MTEEVTHMVVPEIMTGIGREIHIGRSHLWIMRETDMKGTVTYEMNGRYFKTLPLHLFLTVAPDILCIYYPRWFTILKHFIICIKISVKSISLSQTREKSAVYIYNFNMFYFFCMTGFQTSTWASSRTQRQGKRSLKSFKQGSRGL